MGKLRNIALGALFTLAVAGGTGEFMLHTSAQHDLHMQAQTATSSESRREFNTASAFEHGKAALGILAVWGGLAGAVALGRRKNGPSSNPS